MAARSTSFDLVTSVASLHHMDATTALLRMRDLLRPGGVLVVVGLTRSRFPEDLHHDAAAMLLNRCLRLSRPYREHPSPTVWPPPVTFPEMAALVRGLLRNGEATWLPQNTDLLPRRPRPHRRYRAVSGVVARRPAVVGVAAGVRGVAGRRAVPLPHR